MKNGAQAQAQAQVIQLRKGQGHHGRAACLHTGKRYLLVTTSGFAVPVRVLGRIKNLIVCTSTR